MPPSSDQDTTQASSGDSKSGKVSQKTSGVNIPTKNGKKNGTAKDGGGGSVLAAVKRDAKANAKQTAQSTPSKSPEMEPVDSPPNGNPVTSPLLDALSSAAFPRSPMQHTTEWTKTVPAGAGYSTSPSNLISLGESPPTLPSSYEERFSSLGYNTREQRGIPNGHFQSTSPPAPNRRRPLSYNQIDGQHFLGFDDQRSQSSYANRRSSMYSQQPRYGPHPPLPHQAQAHFYGAPDVNLMLSPPTPGLIPGENGYYCGFDKLPIEILSEPSKRVDNVVVMGYEGGINIHSVAKRRMDKIAGIDGLRGGVYNAAILPWTLAAAASDQFPLIAAVVHGPVWPASDEADPDNIPSSERASLAPNESVRGSPSPGRRGLPDMDYVEYYQTTVEVYSIPQNRQVATLLVMPKTPLPVPANSPLFRSPPPIGSLTIRADAGNIIITSGSTGETWIFRQGDITSPDKFKCVGKVWTTVQHGISLDATGPHGPVDGDWSSSDTDQGRKLYNSSIVSLNGRFLAYCPPNPSSLVSLRATVPYIPSSSRVPGLNTQAPPQLPQINCLVETPGGDSMVKQLLQVGTQKFIEGATYLGGQGVQAWNNYWNKPAQSQSPSAGLAYQPQQNLVQQFPPTHGTAPTAPPAAKDPGLISILDLGSLDKPGAHSSSSVHPLATFRVPHGCSFLSFAPSGLALFTASSKGDVQSVWDLMRMQYAKSSFLRGSLQGLGIQSPHVRQIAQFSRMTIARIVDVVWTSPHGERAAMVTEPGTVHILDLPASAFTWPPPRRKSTTLKRDDGSHEASVAGLTASGVASSASSAVNSLWTAARPLVGRPRRSSAGMSVTAQAGHGTQVLAAGISRSVGAATGRMNEMRKSGNAKLHLPRSTSIPARSCIVLTTGKRSDSVIVLGGGIVRFYTIKNRRADRPADKQKASRGAKYVEYRLPSLPDFKFPPEVPRDLLLNQPGDLEATEEDFEQPLKRKTSPAPLVHGTESSIPQAEIESNAPYQPFHTDRRVGLHLYSYDDGATTSPSVSALLSSPSHVAEEANRSRPSTTSDAPWAFGRPIQTTRLDVGQPQASDDDFDHSVDPRALPSSAMERVLRVTDSNEAMEQIVVTTRRRKGTSRTGVEGSGDPDEEGFFEDDCEILDFASQRV